MACCLATPDPVLTYFLWYLQEQNVIKSELKYNNPLSKMYLKCRVHIDGYLVQASNLAWFISSTVCCPLDMDVNQLVIYT